MITRVYGYVTFRYDLDACQRMETLYAVTSSNVVFELPERKFATDFPSTGWKEIKELPIGAEYIGIYQTKLPN